MGKAKGETIDSHWLQVRPCCVFTKMKMPGMNIHGSGTCEPYGDLCSPPGERTPSKLLLVIRLGATLKLYEHAQLGARKIGTLTHSIGWVWRHQAPAWRFLALGLPFAPPPPRNTTAPKEV